MQLSEDQEAEQQQTFNGYFTGSSFEEMGLKCSQ